MLYPSLNDPGWIGRIEGASRQEVVDALVEAARKIRVRDLELIHSARAGHIGGELSIADVLTTLVLHVMNFRPDALDDPERDRLVVSKGHVAAMLYTVLSAGGFIPADKLDTFLASGSDLNGHPSRTKVAAVEANTGPLGHGLPIAVGMAVGGQMDRSQRRTFVVLGDGELQEGSNWEALMFAGHRKLERLTAIVDHNRLQQGARIDETNTLEPLADRVRAFGWEVVEVNGHDVAELLEAFDQVPATSGKPTFIIAHTMKGHPISFMSDNVAWHHKVPNDEQFAQALMELEALA